MNRSLIIGLLNIFLTLNLWAQTSDTHYRPLSQHDFNSNDYTILFFLYDRPMRDLSVLYTRDSAIQNKIMRGYSFDREAVTYPFSCNDGYSVWVNKGLEIVSSYSVKYRCQAFVDGDSWWHYDGLGSAVVLGELDTARIVEKTYSDLQEARSDLERLKLDNNLIGTDNPEWENHDGYFFFRYPNPNKSGRSPFTEWDVLTEKVIKELTKKHSDEQFIISLHSYGYGGNYPNVLFKVKAKESLYKAFRKYPITSGWKDFEPILTTYWAKSTQ